MRILLLAFTASALLGACSACNFNKKKNDDKNGANETSASLFIKDKAFLERSSSLSEAIIRFETTEIVNCEIHFWLVSEGDEIPISERKIVACSGSAQNKNFSEVIANLSTSNLYMFELNAWSLTDVAKEQVSKLKIQETELKSENLIYVARFNYPLRNAEIHQYDIKEGQKASEMLSKALKEFRCYQSQELKEEEWSKQSPQNSFTALTSRGYITANSEVNEKNTNIHRLYYSAIQENDSWEWSVKSALGTGQFLAESAPLIQRGSVTGSNKVDLETPQLTVAEKNTVKASGNTDLTFALAISGSIKSNGFVKIQLGFPDNPNSKTCFFDPKKSPFVITSDKFSSLGKGKHDVLVSLVSRQIQQDIEKKLPPWIVESNDWRIARIEVL